MKGTVAAKTHAYVVVDGVPHLDWNDTLARDTAVSGIGEDITLRMCADTSGNVSVA